MGVDFTVHSLHEYIKFLKIGAQHITTLLPKSCLGSLSPNSLENIYVFDKDLHCLYSTVQEVSALAGVNLFDADIGAVSLEYLKDDLQRVFVTGKILTGQLAKASNAGNQCYEYSLIPLAINDTIEGIQCVIRDTTERQTLKYIQSELNRLDRFNLIGEMAAGVAHEIRNPITVIRGYLQGFHRNPTRCTQERVQLLLNELDRINNIVSEFLTLASNKVSAKARWDLNALLDEIHPLIYEDAAERGIEVDLYFESNLPALDLDNKEIKQLILNLSRNALDVMSTRGKLTIQTKKNSESVELCIADTGNGIPEDVLLKMFDPFFTTKASGTGLGLSVCISIVARHKGTIEVRSEEGKGTEFIISFPVAGSI